MSRGFTCHKCGYGTLVRSNMKLTPDGNPYCRAEDLCEIRQKKGGAREWEATTAVRDELQKRWNNAR